MNKLAVGSLVAVAVGTAAGTLAAAGSAASVVSDAVQPASSSPKINVTRMFLATQLTPRGIGGILPLTPPRVASHPSPAHGRGDGGGGRLAKILAFALLTFEIASSFLNRISQKPRSASKALRT